LQGEIAKGTPMDKALASAGVALPPAQKIAARRADLLRQDQRPPAQISMLFAMTQGNVRSIAIPNDQGVFLVQLTAVQQGDAAKVPGLVDKVRADLSGLIGNEYADQFARAVERDLGVERNPATVANVTKALRDANGGSAQK
jgi:peptidyl-prolyl cis-trans isomerase D